MEIETNKAMEILLQKLEEAKARNPHHSLRAFAQKVGLSSGSLSEILKGKRPLTNSTKKKIADRLLLSPKETLDFFSEDLPTTLKSAADHRPTISQDQFHLISEWWYFGLLNLIKTRSFKLNFNWMAKRLGLSVKTVGESWERLFRLGYLEKKGSKVQRKYPEIKTTDNLKDLSIRKSHLEDLRLIENSLLNVSYDLRDNTSCTFVVDEKDLPKAKEMVRIFQKQFLTQIGKEEASEVYKMSISIYPLTKKLEFK
jgi:uncharacterized protein (TIGR02147 family)